MKHARRFGALWLCLSLVLTLLPLGLSASAATVSINDIPFTATNDTYPKVVLSQAQLNALSNELVLSSPTDRIAIEWPVSWYDGSDETIQLLFHNYALIVPATMLRGLPQTPSSVCFKLGVTNGILLTLDIVLDGNRSWYNHNAPLKLLLVYDTNDYGARVAMSKNGKPVPRSLYYPGDDDFYGQLDTKVYSGGSFAVMSSSFKSFNDMAAKHWAQPAVQLLNARDIVRGTGGGNFSPAKSITRGEFITMLMRTLAVTVDTSGVAQFPDVPSNQYYAPHVLAAKKLGIVGGDSAGRFNPNARIKREELFAMLSRSIVTLHMDDHLSQYIATTPREPFKDWNNVSAYAVPHIHRLTLLGIVNGSKGLIHPQQYTTRAETAQVLANFINVDASLF